MVLKTQLVTKSGVILANFIEGKHLPFSSTRSDILLQIAPHQSGSLVDIKDRRGTVDVGQKEVNVSCVCIGNSSKTQVSMNTLLSKTTREGKSLIWLDPTLIPTECISCVLAKWLLCTKPTDNAGLGIIIPKSSLITPSENSVEAWISTPKGPLGKDFNEIHLPVWYPSLNRNPELLEKIANAVNPFDIFPLVEFPEVIDYDSEREIAAHHSMLDRYRTRTRNLIYLNNKGPEEALKTLFGSFEAISRNGRMPRSLLITPGGTSVSYLITLLAGVFSGGIFITPEIETPFPKHRDIWGFAVFKKCE